MLEVVRTEALIFSGDSGLRRIPPREPDLRPSDYLEKFDSDTFAYDVFHNEHGKIGLVGPPFLNLCELVEKSIWRIDGNLTTPRFRVLDRAVEMFVETVDSSQSKKLSIEFAEQLFEAEIQPSGLEVFAGKRALVTKNRNNDLRWIRDWVRFYVEMHGVQAVLLYDNGSTEYAVTELLSAIKDVGLETAVVVEWPFKFGPQGGRWAGLGDLPWDSDYCEYGILTHARRRFLDSAASVLHCDIDELVVSTTKDTVFDIVELSQQGAISFVGRWVESIPCRKHLGIPVFADFGFVDTKRESTTRKWAIIPEKVKNSSQWKTHGIADITLDEAEHLSHRHFMGISTHWKWNRNAKSLTLDPERHFFDTLLAKALGVTETPEGSFVRDGILNERLEIIRGYVAPRRRFKEFLEKIWYYRPAILVLEMNLDGAVAVAFELSASELGVSLIAIGRNAASQSALLLATSGYSTLMKGSSINHRQLDSWMAVEDPQKVAADIVQLIQRTISDIELSI